MDSTAEINDHAENSVEPLRVKMKEEESSAEAPKLIRRKEDNEHLPEKPDCNVLDHPARVISSMSPDLLMETLTGKGLDFDLGSGPESTAVKELTLDNYKGPELFVGEGSLGKKGLWSNLTRLSGDSVPPDNRTLIKPQSSTARPMQSGPPPEPNYSKVNDYLAESENRIALVNAHGRTVDGIRMKVLSASGFGQFVVRNALQGMGVSHALQGKGVVHTHRENYKEPTMVMQNQNSVIRQTSSVDVDSISSSRLNERVDEKAIGGSKALVGGGSFPLPDIRSDGISLREWIKSRSQKSNKSERLHVFKQVLELVDSSHSQGLVLQKLRPSYFFSLPSNLVKYVGSFVPQSRFEQSMGSDLEQHSKRKRYLEYGNEGPGVLSVKHLKQGMTRGHLLVSRSRRQHTMSELQNMEERWYASPEELKASTCSFSSNIYSLGVLFFELFCCFETSELHSAAMSDLRHRILLPSFLSKSPKEAGFCLWLLHPEPTSRPNSRDILQSDMISEDRDFSSLDLPSASIDEEDAEAELLLHFLLNLKEQKEKQATKLGSDAECLTADIQEVDRRYSSRTEFLSDSCSLETSFNTISDTYPLKRTINTEGTSRFSDSNVNERLMRNVDQLENAYFSLRSKVEKGELPGTSTVARFDTDVLKIHDKYSRVQNDDDKWNKSTDPLGTFFEGLCKYARYNQFEVCGSLRSVDIINSANVICSLSFDRDEDYFATAGVSKKIKIFEFGALLKDNVDIHYPLIEMSSRSKLSCVCWNNYIKNYLASTDYEGVVQLWDASTGQGFAQYKEHRKRAWSVDFSCVDPTKLASGSDDCCVKLWRINERNCIDTIRNVANVCCVQFSSHSSHLLAFGSADYKIYCYDMRHTRSPWCTLAGHGKAVSHVKFVDSETVVSASTDNTLKLWDLKKTSPSGLSTNSCSLTLSGHTNEKNFVGLSVSDGYIVCGSETNDVYAYYRTLPMPITCHKFGSTDPVVGHEAGDDNGQFVSSVCWRSKSSMVVATNSTGSIEVLRMV